MSITSMATHIHAKGTRSVLSQHPSSRRSLPFDSNITGRCIRAPQSENLKRHNAIVRHPGLQWRHRRLKGSVFRMRGGVYVESGVVQ
jgi:hypothetical protein